MKGLFPTLRDECPYLEHLQLGYGIHYSEVLNSVLYLPNLKSLGSLHVEHLKKERNSFPPGLELFIPHQYIPIH